MLRMHARMFNLVGKFAFGVRMSEEGNILPDKEIHSMKDREIQAPSNDENNAGMVSADSDHEDAKE
jgi:hypothetical protein